MIPSRAPIMPGRSDFTDDFIGRKDYDALEHAILYGGHKFDTPIYVLTVSSQTKLPPKTPSFKVTGGIHIVVSGNEEIAIGVAKKINAAVGIVLFTQQGMKNLSRQAFYSLRIAQEEREKKYHIYFENSKLQ